MSDLPVNFRPPDDETVLPDVPPDWSAALAAALEGDGPAVMVALRAVAAAHPTYLLAWGRLSQLAGDPVEAYAYARVGYHRGLDALRGAGWRGVGKVTWAHPSNRGFLVSLRALERAAAAIGEEEEAARCATFLRQLGAGDTPG